MIATCEGCLSFLDCYFAAIADSDTPRCERYEEEVRSFDEIIEGMNKTLDKMEANDERIL